MDALGEARQPECEHDPHQRDRDQRDGMAGAECWGSEKASPDVVPIFVGRRAASGGDLDSSPDASPSQRNASQAPAGAEGVQ